MSDIAEAAPATVVESHEWEIPSYRLVDFQGRIAQANKRLQRAGLDARFEVAYESFDRRKALVPGGCGDGRFFSNNHLPVITEPWVRATLTGPLVLQCGHYTFVAKLVAEQAGVTVHTAPGQELGGTQPIIQ